ESVQLADAPAWMDGPLRELLKREVALEVADDPLDRGSLRRAVEALDAQPWVASVTQVRPSTPGHRRVAPTRP
ncbi:MAG: hypothetical protein AAGL98_04880, partial [Planctomycetota bacterium]